MDTRAAVLPDRGRVVAVFGPPGVGTSTVIRCLAEASTLNTTVVHPDFGDLDEQVRRAGTGLDAVFVDGFPSLGLTPDDQPNGPAAIQYLFDRRLIFPGSGAVIRVACDPELTIRLGRATHEGTRAWYRQLPALEERIRLLSLPYFVIHNEPGESGLAQAVGDLARRASISR